MDDNTRQLIEALASKLGVTTEHLWEILVSQAPISAWTDISIILTLTVLYLWCIAQLKKNKLLTVDMIAVLILVGTLLIFLVVASVSGIVSGLVNPNYWALNELLSLIK